MNSRDLLFFFLPGSLPSSFFHLLKQVEKKQFRSDFNHQDVFFLLAPQGFRSFVSVSCNCCCNNMLLIFHHVCFSKKEVEEQKTVGRAELDLEKLKV